MRRGPRQYYRTLLIGLLAMAVLLWAGIDQFGLSPAVVLQLVFGAVVAVLMVIVCAAAMAGLWMGLRWLLRCRTANKP